VKSGRTYKKGGEERGGSGGRGSGSLIMVMKREQSSAPHGAG